MTIYTRDEKTGTVRVTERVMIPHTANDFTAPAKEELPKTYLLPVSKDADVAKGVRNRRNQEHLGNKNWIVRKGYDGYYVVPDDDRGYDFLGPMVTS